MEPACIGSDDPLGSSPEGGVEVVNTVGTIPWTELEEILSGAPAYADQITPTAPTANSLT